MNGHTHYGQQNYRCLECGRQFVANSQHIDDDQKELIKRLLLERLPLRGICRVCGVSLPWLCGFIAELYDRLPDDLGVRPVAASRRVEVLRLEADELWSFVGSKANKQWISPGPESGN
jgi:insertion element IS1 protein InsB